MEADAGQTYRLTEDDGPWMILATSFIGAKAEQQARALVLELRERYNLPAYIHQRTYDYTQPVRGLGLNPDGTAKMMRYANASKFDEYAVLVGDFVAVNSPEIEDTLNQLKLARPACLELGEGKNTAQRFAILREIQRRLQTKEEKKQRGPMGKAFITRNPLLPAEYFTSSGLDPLVVEMNRDVEHSLLNCPGAYTVKVASFRGMTTWNLDEIERIEHGGQIDSKLEAAAVKAHTLTVALRQKGYEAYEFHDLHESIVTIGSFDSVGQDRADGKTEINPLVHKIMETFKAKRQSLPGSNLAALQPYRLEGISFDVQPLPVKVPHPSVAANYASSRRYLP